MFRTLDDFYQVWEHESASTLQVFEMLTNEALQTQIGPGRRTLGRLANHLVETLTEMPEKMGLPITEETPAHTNVADIVSDYKEKSEQLIAALKSTFTDQTLAEQRNMYGMQWTVAQCLHVIVMHQCHHRGQITVLMRQAGLPVPGIYGPTKEAWAEMGMPALP